MGSVAARFRGPNDPGMPAYVGLADVNLLFADVLGAGSLGGAYEAADGAKLAGRLTLPLGVSAERAEDRAGLCRQFDRLRRELDTRDTMARMDHYSRQALDIVLSGKAQKAFRLDLEPDRVRDAYGRHSLGERTLLARRLVEAGVTFVTVSGTYGMFDNHGDDHFAGGIVKGLKPLLAGWTRRCPRWSTTWTFAACWTTRWCWCWASSAARRCSRREGGRPRTLDQLHVDAGGRRRPAHGQVVGSTDAKGYDVKEARVTPADLGATVYRHLGSTSTPSGPTCRAGPNPSSPRAAGPSRN